MSALIEMTEIMDHMTIQPTALPPPHFIQMLLSILRSPEFQLRACQTRNHPNLNLVVFLGKGVTTFYRDTKWCFSVQRDRLRMEVMIVQGSGGNYLRAQSQRMRFQLMILMKMINNNLPLEEHFFVEPTTGIFKYTFTISWKEYHIKIPKSESLKKFLRYAISQLNFYQELATFCQPIRKQKQQPKQAQNYDDHLKAVNQYRLLMRSCKQLREKGTQSLGKIVQLKQMMRKLQQHRDPSTFNQMQDNTAILQKQIQYMQFIYHSNVLEYHKVSIGLHGTPQNEQMMQNSLIHVEKMAKGQESGAKKQNQNNKVMKLDCKILSGLYDPHIEGQQKLLSRDGAHSQIYRCVLKYTLAKSINEFTKQNPQKWLIGGEKKGQFAYKKCKIDEQTSRNSFMNEIYVLNHLRDYTSSYVCKYFLETKAFQQRNEQDKIFMQLYFQNIDSIIKKCKTISLRERLAICYKIAKGLCFLSGKGVLHRDIKPHNIMVDGSLNPVIIDFGSAAPMALTSWPIFDQRLLTTKFFHIYYHQLPQEYAYVRQKYLREEYNSHPLFDVYSFARVICFIFFGSIHCPHPEQVDSHPYKQLLKNVVFLITMCLNIDPDERPGFGEIASFIGCLSKFISGFEQEIKGKMVRSASLGKDHNQ